MAGNYHAGTALVDVLPSMKRFHSRIRSDLRGVNPQVTVDVVPELKNLQRRLRGGIGKVPPIEVDVRANTAALRKAEQDVVNAEKRITTARDNAKDAAARVDIAEKHLEETRGRSKVKASQIAAAELKVAQAKRAAASASNDARNAESALSSARAAVRDAKAKLDVDTGGAMAQLAAFRSAAGRFLELNAHIDMDTGAALAKLTAFGAAGSAVTAALAGGFGLVGASVVALPGLIGAAGAGIGTLAVGLNGTVDAFKAFSDADKQAAQGATANAKQQTAAARQIASAQQQVAQAKTSLGRAYQDADWAAAASVRRVQDAERQLVAAQRTSLQAQQDLTRARDDAKRAMRDLNFQVQGGALAERQAVLDLADAQAELTTARAGSAGGENLARAQLAYEQQALSLKEIQARNADLAKEKATADRVGVAGSEQVVSAQQRVRDATAGVTEAQRGIADAQRESAQQQVQSQRTITDAQLQVTQAQLQLRQAIQDAGTVGAASVDKINAAMAALSPNARQFVTDVRALKPEFAALGDTVQDKLFAHLGPEFSSFAHQVLPDVTSNLGLVAGAVNGLTRDMLAYGATQQVADQFRQIFQGTAAVIEASSPALQSLLNLFLGLAAAAMPGLTLIIQAVGSLADSIMAALQPLIDSGAFTQALSLIAQLIVALGPLIGQVLVVAIQLWNALGPSLIAVIQALTPVITVLGQLLVMMAPYIGQIVMLLVTALVPILQALTPVIAAVLPVLTQLISAGLSLLVPILQAAVTIFQALWPAVQMLIPPLLSILEALSPIIPLIVMLVAAVAPLIQQFVALLIPILTQVAQIIITAVQQALLALMPLLPQLFALFNQIFAALAPFIPLLLQFATQILAAVLPAIVQLAPVVIMLIQTFAPLLPQLMQLAMILLPTIVSVIRTLMPIVTLLAQILGGVLGLVLRAVVVPLLGLVVTAVTAVASVFRSLWTVAQPIFQAIGAAGQWLYDKALKPAFDGIGNAIDGVIGFFQTLGDVVSGIWAGIKKVVHDGIQGIIDLIYNNGLRKLVNAVIEYIPGLDYLPEIKVPEFARGGVLPGYAPGRDTELIATSPGEGILVPELVRMIGPEVILAANAAAMRGRAYARGGIVGGFAGGLQGFADGGVVGAVGGAGASLPTPGVPTPGTPAAVTIDPAALAGLGDTAAAVTLQITTLAGSILTVFVPALAALNQHTHTTTVAIVTAYNQVWARQFLLQTQYATSWAAITAIVAASTRGQTTAFSALVNGMASVRTAITQTASTATSEFARIRGAAADPIRWVLKQPVNAGIIAAWNRLNSDFALKKPVHAVPIPFATGGKVPGYGSHDTVDAKLTPGEYVLSKPAIRGLGGLAAVDRLHQMARAGIIGPEQRLGGRPGDGYLRRRLMRTVPLDGLGFAYGGVQPHVAAAGAEIEKKFGRLPGGIGGVGSRPNASDHPVGLALDFMTLSNTGLGNKIASYLIANAQRLLIKYLIWQQKFNDGSGWSAMEDRGSITANHMDHVHSSFLRLGQAGRVFSNAGGVLDPASYFTAARRMIGQIAGRYPGNRMAASGAGMANLALKSVITAAEAMSELSASASTAGSPEVKAAVRSVAATFGWGSGPQWNALDWIIGHESGWNPAAANPSSSARGLFQKLTSVNGPIEPTVAGQAKWGLNYIRSRYHDPLGAQRFWQAHHWYDQGGIATGAGMLAKLTPAPERVLSPAQTRSFDTLVGHIGAGHTLTAVPSGNSLDGAQVTGAFYAGDEFVGYIDGRIEQHDQDTGTALLRGRR